MGWIPGQGAKISHAMWQGQKEKKKKKESIELFRKRKKNGNEREKVYIDRKSILFCPTHCR